MTGGRSGDERPVGYPRSYETSLQLADRRRVSVRPMLPSDAPELAEAIRTADPETLRTRFLGGPPPLTDAVLDRLTRLDYTHRFALVARDRTGRGVAVARYMAIPESAEVAEVAVVAHPAWRGVGLATKLIKMLARRALECGITQFTATFLAENRPVTELAHESHARVAIRQGVAVLQVRLTAGDVGTDGSGAAGQRQSASILSATDVLTMSRVTSRVGELGAHRLAVRAVHSASNSVSRVPWQEMWDAGRPAASSLTLVPNCA